MNADRIEAALKRIEAAIERIDSAREIASGADTEAGGGSARVIQLVNNHERLREQVSESLIELDVLLTKFEE